MAAFAGLRVDGQLVAKFIAEVAAEAATGGDFGFRKRVFNG